jgi:hypothetical protein
LFILSFVIINAARFYNNGFVYFFISVCIQQQEEEEDDDVDVDEIE